MIVDWHAHIYTPEEAADDKGAWDGNDGPRWGDGGCPMVLENFLKAHHAAGVDVIVAKIMPYVTRLLDGATRAG